MIMKKFFPTILSVGLVLLFSSCATTEPEDPQPAPYTPLARCELNSDDMATVLVNSMDKLLSEWPVLDRECETFLHEVQVTKAGQCLLVGASTNAEGCDTPDYRYKVAYNPDTLEAHQVYWTGQ